VNKNKISFAAGYLVCVLSIVSCTKPPPAVARSETTPSPTNKTSSSTDSRASTHSQRFSGKVVETMDASNYTYVLVDTGKEKQWAAAPQFPVKVGDPITIEDGIPMSNHHSKTLNRDFDVVYFTGRAIVGAPGPGAPSGKASLPQGHPPLTGTGSSAPSAKVDLTGIKKAEGGKTIAEIYASKPQIAGKEIKVRGKVVKYNAMIMGKNWVHLQDGSGTEGSNDLTLTTAATVKVGDTVLASGTLSVDKDYGFGYQYDMIMEDAKLVAE
jgi:hypothetical protein